METKIIDFIKSIPIELVKDLISSQIIASLVVYYFYKANVKWKHRKLTVIPNVAFNVTKILKRLVGNTLLMPWMVLGFLFIAGFFIVHYIVLVGILIFIIIFWIFEICEYIRSIVKANKISALESKIKKVKQFIYVFFSAISIMIIGMINLFLSGVIYILTTDFPRLKKEMLLELDKFLFTCLALYFLSIFFIVIIYILNLDAFQKEVSSVKIFYTQNGMVRSNSNIKFENFDIDKNFTYFYSDTSRTTKIIQTKDLIGIEYSYKN